MTDLQLKLEERQMLTRKWGMGKNVYFPLMGVSEETIDDMLFSEKIKVKNNQ
jgi:hypothetical protein